MKNSFLSQPVLALAHNVELNRAGWSNRAVERLLLGALWLDRKAASISEIRDRMHTAFDLRIESPVVESVVDRLAASGSLKRDADGRVRIAPQVSEEIERELLAVEADESAASALWEKCIQEEELGNRPTWEQFKKKGLGPLVLEQGAGTYSLFVGESPGWNRRLIDGLTGPLKPEDITRLRRAVGSFLGAADPSVRSYLLRTLRAHLSWQAGQLPTQVIDKIIEHTDEPPRFVLFLDTNFLFSLLKLHDNPANDAAYSLARVIKSLPPSIDIRLYVLPITADEAKRTLIANKMLCSGLRLTPNLASAVLEVGNLGGIVSKYVQRCLEAGESINPDDYFSPYLDDLTTVMKAHGITLYNASMSPYTQRQDVVDDIHEIQDLLGKGKRSKSFEQIQHDAVLWHVAEDKRSSGIESPVEATFWVVTVDYRLLGFDAYKHQRDSSLPVCIHPTNLVQMLSFWIPRSPALDDAMVECMRVPFLFEEFDRDAEEVTLRILKVLSRFENVGDLPKEASLALLVNRALRDRLSERGSEAQDVGLVRDALLTRTTELEAAAESAKKGHKKASARAAESEKVAELLRARMSTLEEKLAASQAVLKSVSDLEARLNFQETELAARSRELQKVRIESARRRFWPLRLVLAPLGSGLFGGFVGGLVAQATGLPMLILAVLSGTTFLFGAGAVLSRFPTPTQEVAEWRFLVVYRRIVTYFLAVVMVGLVLQILGSVLSDQLTQR